MPTVEIDPDLPASLTGETSDHVVLRYDPDAGILLPLPNVLCLSVSARVGAEPWSARFRYKFSQLLDPSVFPSSFEQVFLLSSPGAFAGSPFVVRQEDRLIVRTPDGDGSWRVLFDGFARLPQVDYGPSGEVVTFECLGTPERCWDEPIGGAVMTDRTNKGVDSLPVPSGVFVRTSLPARFNPDGKPNASPEPDQPEPPEDPEEPLPDPVPDIPIFVDVDERTPDELGTAAGPEKFRRHWSLAMAAKYILASGNGAQEFVENPTLALIDRRLSSIRPLADAIDWSDPTTFELDPILCPDLDVTGMAWPEALQQLLEPFGFTIAFELATTPQGLPRWGLLIRRNDDNTYWKALGLQARGAAFDPNLTATSEVNLQRSGPSANEIVVDAAPDLVEASFVLAPIGWSPVVADGEGDGDADKDKAVKDRFIKGTEVFEPIPYRFFGLDESGEWHWDFLDSYNVLSGWSGHRRYNHAPDLSAVFPPDPINGDRMYVKRLRPGSGRLLSKDEQGQERKMELWFAILEDYATTGAGQVVRPVPGVYEPLEGVQWQQVTQGGWRLLPDRLGIEITTEDVRSWEVTKNADKPVCPSGTLDLVGALAKPSYANPKKPRVVFRLTTVVEADQMLPAGASRRFASPTKFTIKRRVDTRDRFGREIVAPSSIFHGGGPRTFVKNDEAAATDHARARQREAESVRFAGQVTIPRLTAAIRPADKLVGLSGRDVLLGGYQPGNDEGPRYPMVVGVEWHLDNPQSTRLLLDDRTAESWTVRQVAARGPEAVAMPPEPSPVRSGRGGPASFTLRETRPRELLD